MPRLKIQSHGTTLILDAYNVIHAVPVLERHLESSLESARNALTQLCADYLARKGNLAAIFLVFDGRAVSPLGWMAENHFKENGIQGIFSDSGQSADDKIIELLEEAPDTRKICVVSNDNYVKNNARSQGAASLSVKEFALELLCVKTKSGVRNQGRLSEADYESITNDYKNHLGIKD